MANSSNRKFDVDYRINGTGPQHLYEVQIDTINTDLELSTAQTDRHMQMSACFFAEANAANLKFKSRSPLLGGTVSTSSGSATITGVGTEFTKQFVSGVGQEVVVTGGNTLTVLTVDSDTQITASSTASSTVSGATYKRQKFINRSVELVGNQGLAKGFSNELLPIVAEKSGSLVMQSDALITSMTMCFMFPGKLTIGNKN